MCAHLTAEYVLGFGRRGFSIWRLEKAQLRNGHYTETSALGGVLALGGRPRISPSNLPNAFKETADV